MLIFHSKSDLQNHLETLRSENKKIGFVPTMGALHLGHLSLIALSKESNDVTVCSIFVNPTQFNDPKDFEKYPSTIEADKQLLISEGCDILFFPTVDEMYPNGLNENKHFELGELEQIWEGEHRPGHFQGVCLIVEKLLQLVLPDTLFLGEKDFQQVAVLRKMIAQHKDLSNIQVLTGKTIREADGLAMSSRNLRLNPEERKQALAIYKGFQFIQQGILNHSFDLNELKKQFEDQLYQNGFHKIDYIAFVEPNEMREISQLQFPFLVIVAAFLGQVRLIDNFYLTHEHTQRI
ncbi:MAG: pantoate--beta-alanine ligase [Aquirufa sp.]